MALKFTLYPVLSLLIFFINYAGAQKTFTQKGMASYYSTKFQGKKTASGEIFDMNEYTAAHKTLPFQTLVKVTNLANKKSVVVRINDRGPFSKKRIIDLSKASASKIDLVRVGIAKVKIEVVETDKSISKKGSEEKDENSYVLDNSDPVYSKIKDLEAGKTYNEHWHVKEPSGYGIQIASLSKISHVAETIEKIKKEGMKDVYIQVLIIDKKKTYRIMVGQHTDIEAAEKDLDKLENIGYKGFIKKYKF